MTEKILNKAFLLEDNKLKELIDQRKNDLEKEAILNDNKSSIIYHGYIPETTPFQISNLSLYSYNLVGIDYFEYIKFLKEKNVDANNLVNILITTGMYVSDFFNHDCTTQKKDCRELYIIKEYEKLGLMDIIDIAESRYFPSINLFKGKGEGLCLEHALLMQNLLSFIGIDCTKVDLVGDKEGNYIGHSVNFINFELNGQIKHLYYDLISIDVILDENNKIKTMPAFRLIEDKKYQAILRGDESFDVEYKNPIRESGKISVKYYINTKLSLSKLMKK